MRSITAGAAEVRCACWTCCACWTSCACWPRSASEPALVGALPLVRAVPTGGCATPPAGRSLASSHVRARFSAARAAAVRGSGGCWRLGVWALPAGGVRHNRLGLETEEKANCAPLPSARRTLCPADMWAGH